MKTDLLTIDGELSDTVKDALKDYRILRIKTVEKILSMTERVHKDLLKKYDPGDVPPSVEDVKETLKLRLWTLNERLKTPGAIYEDELNFFKNYLEES